MLRPIGGSGDEGQADSGLHDPGEFVLGLLGGVLQALQCHPVLGQVDPAILLELGHQVVDDPFVKVIPAQEVVAIGGLHLEHAFAQLQDGNVESAASQVEHQDCMVLALIDAIGQGGGGRFIDDPQHIETGDAAGILGRLALAVGEVGRSCDHRLGDFLAQVGLGIRLQLL